jgi:hypothetical protein
MDAEHELAVRVTMIRESTARPRMRPALLEPSPSDLVGAFAKGKSAK